MNSLEPSGVAHGKPLQRRRTINDPHDLDRFVTAQASTYDTALAELRRGRKASHWMWFIFPQVAGLGFSATSQRYAIGSLDEARAYLDHPVLGPRLVRAVEAVNAVEGRAHTIFGAPDDIKFQSSLTLFEQAASTPEVFAAALSHYYNGQRDTRSLAL